MSNRAVFIAATGQNVGKTTLCLGLIAALQKRYTNVGFIKPVGQQHVKVDDGRMVDKDAVLFKDHFSLKSEWEDISPVIIPSGFTRRFLDGEIEKQTLFDKILHSYNKVQEGHDYTIVEGTGHTGVGSIVGLNNARVAAELGLDMVIISSGGLGSAFDELALNIAMCHKYGVKVRGVILNRVIEDKRSMIEQYFPKALSQWDIPLLGCVPYSQLLSSVTMRDFANLFNTELLAGMGHDNRHFSQFRLVAGSLDAYLAELNLDDLVITPASRVDIIEATIKHQDGKLGGLVLTGRHKPGSHLVRRLEGAQIPVIYAPMCSFDAMKKITSHVTKIQVQDNEKIDRAILLAEKNIDIDHLVQSKTGGSF